MDAPGTVPPSINCHACGSVIDLTGREGFTHVECRHCGALSVVPLQFGNFLLLSSLGVGGIGTVYKAIDLPLNRYLALKILRKKLAENQRFVDSFSREARAAASVSHPNVAQVYSFGEREGRYYLAMELLERGSLDDRLSQRGRLTEAEVLDIGVQIASALGTAQRRGLLHCDVKPGNIQFNDDGIPKIVDFGLARAETTAVEPNEQPRTGSAWGTPYYCAPETLAGQPEDLRSDIYSLGVTMFHALAGRQLFEGGNVTDFAARDAVQPALLLKEYAPHIHQATVRLISRMLARNPAERYQTYDELICDLKEAQTDIKTPAAESRIVPDSNRRFNTVLILTGVGALIASGALAWLLWTIRLRLFGQ